MLLRNFVVLAVALYSTFLIISYSVAESVEVPVIEDQIEAQTGVAVEVLALEQIHSPSSKSTRQKISAQQKKSKLKIARKLKIKPKLLLATAYQRPSNAGADWIGQYWVSEKLDGVRGHWTGSQLFTRQGNPINAPASFTANWPKVAIDGELWMGRGQFEKVSSLVRRKKTDPDAWDKVRFMVFDLPDHKGSFNDRLAKMHHLISTADSKSMALIKQEKVVSLAALDDRLERVVKRKGEGLMLHHQDSIYHQGRSKQLMKLKKHYDAEATVIAHLPGKGKYKNQMGSLLVTTTDGVSFKIGSGFSDQQRRVPPPIGSVITFKYYAKTKNGVPRFASFMRIRALL